MADSLKSIGILSAWAEDLTANLSSYESQVKGVRNLIDFALTSKYPTPPRVLFLSSQAVLQCEPTRLPNKHA